VIIVSGHLTMDAAARPAYLEGCVAVVEAARRAPGCLEFSVAADLLDSGRVVVLERWESADAVAAFRGSGPSDQQQAMITGADVAEYEIASWRSLTD
jgi:quinol monooxygenase YgiN